jgi:hypothetical protein
MVPSLSVLRHLVQAKRSERQDHAAARAAVTYLAPENSETRKPAVYLNISAGAAIEIARRLGCSPEPAHELSIEAFEENYKKSAVILISTHGLQGVTSA